MAVFLPSQSTNDGLAFVHRLFDGRETRDKFANNVYRNLKEGAYSLKLHFLILRMPVTRDKYEDKHFSSHR